MTKLIALLVALLVDPISALAMAPPNQVFRCDINPNEAVYVTLDQGLLSYIYQNAEDPTRNVTMPIDGTNNSISLYHTPQRMVDSVPVETIRISFHIPHAATVISMDMSPEDEAFSIPSIQFMNNGQLVQSMGCLYDSDEMFLMRTALANNQIRSGYSVDKHDPIAPK